MPLELFKPVMKKVEKGLAHNIKVRREWLNVRTEVWDVLEEVIKGHPVLLNVPTLTVSESGRFRPFL